MKARARLALAAGLALGAACGPDRPFTAERDTRVPPDTAPAAPAPADPAGRPATVLAAGDIASCASSGDEATAELLDALVASRPDAVVAALGDLAYDSGTPTEFAECYAPSWGRHRHRTRPAVGNHDAATPGAAGYRAYFGLDGPPYWNSYDLGAWHVVVLDSNCALVGCQPGSAQERWLRADLADHPRRCTLAYWHHAHVSSGTVHGPDRSMAPLVQALVDGGADVALAGHEHNYERFAPEGGLRSFVVGTGGASHYPVGTPAPGSEVRDSSSFGVLVLTLGEDSYEWEFVPAAGGAFTDRGGDRCR